MEVKGDTMKKDFIDVTDLTKAEIEDMMKLALDLKKDPGKYSDKLKQKTLMMIFEKPSLRTRLSFETGMTQLGGHAIYYDLSTSPMGKKESVSDTAKTASRFVDIIMARVNSHEQIQELAKKSAIPVINALTNYSHPCQIISDLLTIYEKKSVADSNKGVLKGLKLAYLGDSNNNVTHSLLQGCSIMGMNIAVASPEGKEYEPNQSVVQESREIAKKSGSNIFITNDPVLAVKDADVVYTDSWMSYHIPESQKEDRIKMFMPYQVNKELMKHAKKDAIFMNCLPALREMEQTAEVIDGKQSVVFDQAENRLHMQKALMLKLLKVA